jgi:hypothetical protein
MERVTTRRLDGPMRSSRCITRLVAFLPQCERHRFDGVRFRHLLASGPLA